MSITTIFLCLVLSPFFAYQAIKEFMGNMDALLEWFLSISVLIAAVLVLRWLLKGRVSCRARYALWLVVLVRVLLPIQLDLPVETSVARMSPEPPQSWNEHSIRIYQGTEDIENAHEYYQDLEPGAVGSSPWSSGYVERSEDGQTLTHYWDVYTPAQVMLFLWRLGILVTGWTLAVANLRFSLRLKRSRKPLPITECPLPVYVADGIPSPCLAGTFHPAIYLTPETAADETRLRHVLAHELTHHAHKDHIWALLRCLCLCLHWFNPLVWLAVWLSKVDGELACDEGAVRRLGEEERISYGRTLVDMVARSSRGNILSCSTTMTGGKKSVQQRIELLVKHPETKKAAAFLAVAALVVAAVFTFAGDEPEPVELGLPTGEEGYAQFLALLENDLPMYFGEPILSDGPEYPDITSPDIIPNTKATVKNHIHPLEEPMANISFGSVLDEAYHLRLYAQGEVITEHSFCLLELGEDDWYIFLRESDANENDTLIPIARTNGGVVNVLKNSASLQLRVNDEYWMDPALGYRQLMDGLAGVRGVAVHGDGSGFYAGPDSPNYPDFTAKAVELLAQAQPLSAPVPDVDAPSGPELTLFDELGTTSPAGWNTLEYYLHSDGGDYYLCLRHDGDVFTPVAQLPHETGEGLLRMVREADPQHRELAYSEFLYALEDLAFVRLNRPELYLSSDYPPDRTNTVRIIQEEDDLRQVRELLADHSTIISAETYGHLSPDPYDGWDLRAGFLHSIGLDLAPLSQDGAGYSLYTSKHYGFVLLWHSRMGTIPVATLDESIGDTLLDLSRPYAEIQPEIEQALYYIEPPEPVTDMNPGLRYTVDDRALIEQLSQLFLSDPETVALNESPDYDMADWLTNWTNEYIIGYGQPTWLNVQDDVWYAKAVDSGSWYSIRIPEHLVDDVLAICASPLELARKTPVYAEDSQTAVESFGQKLAEAYRTLAHSNPHAVTDAKFISAEIYDQNELAFCAYITLAVAPVEPNTVHWMAGSGIDPITTGEYAGYWRHTLEYRLELAGHNAWQCTEAATGGLRAD